MGRLRTRGRDSDRSGWPPEQRAATSDFPARRILVIVAFIPKYAALLLIMPQPVIGALMVFTASFMIAGGI